MGTIESTNPATGERLERFEETSPGEIERVLADAEHAFREWRERTHAERAAVLREAARRLREAKTSHARTMALEMGKPVAQGEAEAEKCAAVCDWAAEHAGRVLAEEPAATEARRSAVRFEPLGPILAVMPWNFPYWQVFRFAAPALAAGNVAVLKHASNVPRCALEIERVLRESGLPRGAFRAVLVGSGAVAAMIDDPRIRAVTLTGSERAGIAVAERAGRSLKKTVLELGGSDPFLVLDDADVERVAEKAAAARLLNGGQSCIAAKRFVVAAPIAERFLEAFVAAMTKRRVGDPLRPDTDVGPQARRDLREALHRQVAESAARGARLLCGGTVPPGPGAFYPPTVLADVAPGMPAWDEETFGPVAAVVRARSDDEAVEIANDTRYGLGASIWTSDPARAERLVPRLEAGSVFVNEIVKSDPRLPFGGVKRSGHGRELGELGLREFVNAKTVWVGEAAGAGESE